MLAFYAFIKTTTFGIESSTFLVGSQTTTLPLLGS